MEETGWVGSRQAYELRLHFDSLMYIVHVLNDILRANAVSNTISFAAVINNAVNTGYLGLTELTQEKLFPAAEISRSM